MSNGDNIPALPATVVTGSTTDDLNSPNKFKINGGDFYCFFEISPNEFPEDEDSPETTQQTNKIRLTKSAIVNLDIRENLFEPFISGHITINNPFDYVEDNHFTRGDGTDYLHVTLCEWRTWHREGGPAAAVRYTFVLVDENNSVSKTDRSNNFKTYALLDKNYAKLNRQIPYKTKYPKDDKPQLVGDIIREVLIDGLGDPGIIGEVWHSGDHEIGGQNAIYQDHVYIPLNWKYTDLLKHLLRINYSLTSGGELPVQTVLKYNRDTQQYTLEAIDDIFAQNKALTIEGFGLGDLTGNIDARSVGEKGDLGTNKNNPVDSSRAKQGSVAKINTYEGMLKNANLTTPMLNYGNEFFINYLIGHSSSFDGTFSKSNVVYISDIVPLWREAFVGVFKCVGGPPVPFVPVSREGQTTIKPMSFPELETVNVMNIAKAQLVSNLTFLNLQLTLDTPGDTERHPGRFVDIFKLTTKKQETFSDAKMLGRWLITKVHHRFFKDSYENVIQCAKTYVGPEEEEPELIPRVSTTDTSVSPIVAKPRESEVVDEPPPPSNITPDLGPGGQDVIDLDITIPPLPEGDGTVEPAVLPTGGGGY
jgi:hypothetical protein